MGTDIGQGTIINFARGSKFFELSNHLGNVLATSMDSKTAVSVNGSIIDHYEAHLASAQDYYPFGMLEPGRSWNAGNYRYGFNGKENDNEVKGEGNQQDYGMRIYDPRVGRFLSVDPITKKYPELTPYQFASNTPIRAIDRDGLETAIPEETSRYEREREELEREELHRDLRDFRTEPEYEKEKFEREHEKIEINGRVRYIPRIRAYFQGLPEAAQNTFAPNTFSTANNNILLTNRQNGRIWENIVSAGIAKNPLYVKNATQVTLELTGEVDGKVASIRIRVDNLSLKRNGQLDINEAKFSVEQINYGNYTKTLTRRQGEGLLLFQNSNNFEIIIRGEKGLDLDLKPGTVITGMIDNVNIFVPKTSPNQTGSNASSQNSTTSQNKLP